MPFKSLLGSEAKLVQIEVGKKKAPAKSLKRGCDYCPLNERKDLNKVFSKIHGHKLFIFGMCPGENENKERKPFVGRAGEFLWNELKKVGIKRKHVDIDNVVRCYSSDYDKDTKRRIMRNPTVQELRCCSAHTEERLQKSNAKIYLILGMIAAKQLLGKEYKANVRVLWSENLGAKVYALYHPSYFIRQGGIESEALKEWRKSLAALSQDLKGEEPLTPYGYIESRDYRGIYSGKEAEKEVDHILKVCKKKKIRVSFDLEDDTVNGVNVPLVIGTSIKKGRSRVFFVGKWDIKHGEAHNWRPRPDVVKAILRVLADPKVEKVCHHGSYDVKKIEKLLKVHIRSYTYDTEYAWYLSNPNRRGKMGLDQITLAVEPKFGEYKTITLPECLPKEFNLEENGLKKATPTQIHDFISAKGLLRLAQLPDKKLILYNGADCDATKHIEIRTKKEVPLPLLRVYCDAAFTLDEMTPNGPWFDFDHLKTIRKIYPPRLKRLLKSIRKIAGKPDFNPGSYPQMAWLMAKKLKLLHGTTVTRKGKETLVCSTDKGSLEGLARKYEIARLILEYRRVKKIISTYMDSYEYCAKANHGRLRTKWNLTGTATGRMSSGGARQSKGETKVVNLQNIINDPLLQNLAVPSKRWRRLYRALRQLVKQCLNKKYLKRLLTLLEELAKEKDKDKKWALTKEVESLTVELKKKVLKHEHFSSLIREFIEKYGDYSVMLGFDQGQVEVRVAAQMSGDKNLIADCKKGDIHSRVGHTITGWKVEMIKKDKNTRTVTKNIHFGILFGLSEDNVYAFVIAKDPDTTMSEQDVRAGYRRYFKRYPGIKELVLQLRAQAEKTGYVVSMFKFKRPLNVSNNMNSSGDEGHTSGAYWANQAINCLDFKTEGLTQRGWVKGTDLKIGDVALTKNPENGNLEWQTVQDVKIYPDYDVPLVKFYSKSFNAASTLDHRWLVSNGKCKTTAELLKHKWHHIPRTGKYNSVGEAILPDDVVRLAGWFLTDGYSRKEGGWYGGHGFALCQSNIGNPKKVKMIDELAERLRKNYGFHVRTKLPKNRSKGEVFWSFSGGLASYLQGVFPKRTLTPQFLNVLTNSQLEILLHTMVLGDGWGSKLSGLHRNHTNGKISFCTGVKKQADAFQILCMLTGRVCSVKKRDMSKYAGTGGRSKGMSSVWICNVLRRDKVDVAFLKKKLIKNKGVWCPVVPNTYFIARRHGQVFVTGNSPIQGSAHQLMLMAMAMMRRDPKGTKKKTLGVPGMEVHDFMGWWTKLKNLDKAYKAGKRLLEKSPLEVVKKDFPDIDWKVPLEVEGKVGLRYGDSVEVEEGASIGQMLVDMFFATWRNETKLQIELAKEGVVC